MVNKDKFKANINKNQKWFFFALLYLVIDYGRPQDVLPIGAIRPGMIIVILMSLFILSNLNLVGKAFSYKQFRLILYFNLLLLVHVPFAENNYWAYLAAKNMMLFIPFILSIIICVDSIKRLKILITTLIVLMLYMSLFSIFNKGMGTGAYFKDENDLSLYVNTYIPFSYFLLLSAKKKYEKIFHLLCIGFGLLSIVVSFSRGGLVGLIAMVLVAWFYAPNKIRNIFILCLLLLASIPFLDEAYINEMGTIANTDSGTANERMMSWKAAWYMFLDNPMGVGGNNFMIRFPEYQAGDFERGMWGRAAHSLLFTLLPELGLLGIFIYLKLLYINVKDIFKVKKATEGNAESSDDDSIYLNSLSLALLASLAGYFASAIFLSVLYYPHYYYLTAIIVVMMNLSYKKSNMALK